MKNLNTYGFSEDDYYKISKIITEESDKINSSIGILFFLLTIILFINKIFFFEVLNTDLVIYFNFFIGYMFLFLVLFLNRKTHLYNIILDILLVAIAVFFDFFQGHDNASILTLIILIGFQSIVIKKYSQVIKNQSLIVIATVLLAHITKSSVIALLDTINIIAYGIIGCTACYFLTHIRIDKRIAIYKKDLIITNDLINSQNEYQKLSIYARESDTIYLEYDIKNKAITFNEIFIEKYPFFKSNNNSPNNFIKNLKTVSNEDKNRMINFFDKTNNKIENKIEFEINVNRTYIFRMKSIFVQSKISKCLILIKDVTTEVTSKRQFETQLKLQDYQLSDYYANFIYNLTSDKLVKLSGNSKLINIFEIGDNNFTINKKVSELIPFKEDRINFLKNFEHQIIENRISNNNNSFDIELTTIIEKDFVYIKLQNQIVTNPLNFDKLIMINVKDRTINYHLEHLLNNIVKYDYDFIAILNNFTKIATIYSGQSKVKKENLSEFIESINSSSKSDLLELIGDYDDVIQILKNNSYAQFIYETTDNLSKIIKIFKMENGNLSMIQSDITAYNEYDKKNLEQLQSALNTAKIASKAKSVFLSSMSHDIRTPLNAIIGLTEIALDNLKEKREINQIENYSLIRENSNQLLNLVNSILEMSSMEANKITLNEEVFDLEELITKIPERLQASLTKSNIQVKTIIEIQNKILKADKLKLSRIIENLFSNAIKFSNPKGVITITCQETESYSQMAKYHITIKDDGVGMSKYELDHIFEPFVTSKKNSNKGTGLGLSIVKNLVETLNGEISVISKEDNGTSFIIELPLALATFKKQKPSEGNSHDFKNFHILIVEDNLINAKILTKILEAKNITVYHAKNGLDGVNFYQSNKKAIDLILMDIQMPIKNGYQASLEIRKFDKEVPIIAISANTLLEDEKKSLNSGMNDYLHKPINKENLFNSIGRYYNLNQ